jgi:nucleoside-diphosphate-sugar epimerase
MNSLILLTGADGFVGSAVRDAAGRRGIAVRAASRRQTPAFDILRPDTLRPAMEGVGTIVHAAGAAHVFQRTAAAEDWMRRTNVEGTRNVVAAARRAGARHVVLVSSVSVYSSESDVYAESNRQGEQAAIEEAGDAVALTILRLATVYGEGDRGNVLRLVRAIDRGRFVWIGQGANRKTLIHRDDAGAAIVAAAVSGTSGVFNVAMPPVTMREVVAAIARALGAPTPRLVINARAAMLGARALSVLTLHHRRAAALERTIAKWCSDEVHDGSEFCERFGFAPAVDLAQGIAREVDWYRRHIAPADGMAARRRDE